MSGIIYYVLDTETTGLVYKNNYHEITELSIIRAPEKQQLTKIVKVDKPMNSSADALKITGKTLDDLKVGISKSQLIDIFEKFISLDGLTPAHRCLVGHNIISFDRKFMWQLYENHNKRFPFDLYLDTMHFTKAIIKERGLTDQKANLHASCDLFQIVKKAGKHNASSDARNTYLLWEKLMQEGDHLSQIKRIPHFIDDEEPENDLV